MGGATKYGPEQEDEEPRHEVTFSQPFCLGKYEVTQAQFQSVMGSNPSRFKDCGGNCPVEQLSWNDAQNFISRLNLSLTRLLHEGDTANFTYRLPTEAEWEYACRAGTTGDYAGNLSEMAWYLENSGSKTHAVGGKRPNAWDLYDMHGNVSEFCQDWYDGDYMEAPTDGSASSRGAKIDRVMRGGSWFDVAKYLRSAFRGWVKPVLRLDDYGFRVAVTVR